MSIEFNGEVVDNAAGPTCMFYGGGGAFVVPQVPRLVPIPSRMLGEAFLAVCFTTSFDAFIAVGLYAVFGAFLAVSLRAAFGRTGFGG